MKKFLRKFIDNQNPFLLFYHKLKAMVAALIYRFPASKMKVIGVTGTNGKTTTCNVVTHLLMANDKRVGMLSSIRFRIGDQQWDNKTKMSSQSPFKMQKMLRQMVNAGCEYAVVEVTSHAVTQSRIWGINFDVAVWTNLSDDHLDYHGSFMNYMHAKGTFISSLQGMRRKPGVAKSLVLYADDPQFSYFDQFNADNKYTYGIDKGTVKGREIVLRSDGSSFRIEAPNVSVNVDIKLIGDFNVLNCLAATSVMLALQFAPEQIAKGFESLQPIPGRYEPVDAGQPFTVIVDYAHTEDALRKLCQIFKGLTEGRLFLVFGCTGGGRDKGKRPRMGAIAAKEADYVIMTDDDPYEENRLEIVRQIEAGFDEAVTKGAAVAEKQVIVDRATAIECALELAEPGDTVLVAGKGCEQVMAIDGKLIPWDDREVVHNVLSGEQVIDLV